MALELEGRKVVVLGLGDTGLSMARWLARRGARVRVADSRAAPPHAARARRASCPDVPLATGAFTRRDAARRRSRSRSAPASTAASRRSRRRSRAACPVVGDVELFAQALPRRRARSTQAPQPKVLAITGSNGKSTVTAMAGDVLPRRGAATRSSPATSACPCSTRSPRSRTARRMPAGVRARALQLPAREHRDASPPTRRRCST